MTPSRLPALLAQCREEDPEVEVRLFEVPLAQQFKGLHDDLYGAGFSMADDVGDGIVVTPAWEDELVVAVPARHPVLAFKQVPLEEVLHYPLVLGDPAICEGYARQVDRILRKHEQEPLTVQHAATFDLMMALVSPASPRALPARRISLPTTNRASWRGLWWANRRCSRLTKR